MPMQERMMADLKEAMKASDTIRKGVLSLLRAGLANAAKEKKFPLTEQEEIAVIQKELKQTRQALSEAEKSNRTDIVDRETAKIAIIESYLPKQLSREEIVSVLKEAGVGSGMKMGDAMNTAKTLLAGKADNALVSQVVRELIA